MKTFLIAVKFFLFVTLITGIVYPVIITGMVQTLFPEKADGSLITRDNEIIGSSLIGQSYNSPLYFTSRPSAVSYNPVPSGGSNEALTNAKLKNQVKERRQHFISFNMLDTLTEVPSEMLFASASGLDPHISPRAAYLQVDRIAKARHFSNMQKQELEQLIRQETEAPQFLFLGQERVNVLLLNLKTDKIK